MSKNLFYYVHRVFPQIPLVTRLPFGKWWLMYRDAASVAVLDDDWERGERGFMCGFLRPGMTFVDVGASFGFYTLLASYLVGYKGKVISFEPIPSVRRRLTIHTRINRCGNVMIEGRALGDEVGVSAFFVASGHTDLSGLRAPPCHGRIKKIQVFTDTFDNYTRRKNISTVDLVKVDVEGAELLVLRGSLRWLTHRPRPLWLIELMDANTIRFGYIAKEVVTFLLSKGFSWFSITDPEHLWHLSENKTTFDDVKERNFVAVPEERLPEVAHLIQGSGVRNPADRHSTGLSAT